MKQISNASSWNKVLGGRWERSAANSGLWACNGLRGTLFAAGETLLLETATAPSDIWKYSTTRTKLLRWVEGNGFDLSLSALLEGKIRGTERGMGWSIVRSRKFPCVSIVGSIRLKASPVEGPEQRSTGFPTVWRENPEVADGRRGESGGETEWDCRCWPRGTVDCVCESPRS